MSPRATMVRLATVTVGDEKIKGIYIKILVRSLVLQGIEA